MSATNNPPAFPCDVCREHSVVGVASSALGPVSWGYCQMCLDARAEPAVMIEATLYGCEGVENIAGWVRENISTYIDGAYLTFDEAAAMLSTRKEGREL